ncbi:sel1 repeat family protein [Salmonella enterica subsp. enterica serovar Idikan]|nr:sel1 repeat family protein [Salmonella enterica subsp. enterica serovar Ealing]EBM4506605.1 sel1 repeat family protein [Salmonella enterica]ECC8290418.1 sel1 repeat family protein [Salmonella enterica subsp. enterica serovar Krefeld]EDQ7375393.1 sel1 repeat family protein [Salmonella enterica subsp. enterica serovar Holcomb]ECR7165534.1 sel1 repeat family protein [Salmonella enterica]
MYNLTDEQKFELENKSKDGDSEASFRLYQYYCFTINNIDEQLRYLKISASQGNIIAQYNYGIYLSNTNPDFSKYYDLDKAIYWMGLASKNGDIGAQNKLQELKKLKN